MKKWIFVVAPFLQTALIARFYKAFWDNAGAFFTCVAGIVKKVTNYYCYFRVILL